VVTPDDRANDAVWAGVMRGDLKAAQLASEGIEDETLRRRAGFDLIAARNGRAAALIACLDAGDWMAARFDASALKALRRLRGARRQGIESAALWIEEARRSPTLRRQISAASAAVERSPGGAEGLAIQLEAMLAIGRLEDAIELLEEHGAETARLRLLQRHIQGATGRWLELAAGVLVDVQEGLAVPASLGLLEDAIGRVPMWELEEEARALLGDLTIVGSRMARARDRLMAMISVRAGDLGQGIALLSRWEPRMPGEDAALHRWHLRLGRDDAQTLEESIESDPARQAGRAVFERRLADEWDLAARASYRDSDDGHGSDLDAFCERLDAAAASLPGRPSLAALPRRDYGVFGAMLDTDPLAEVLPDALILGGKALSLPAELAWYDRLACASRQLPGEWGEYAQCLVRRQRVRGYAASRGVSISGAGIDRIVYLDLDKVEAEERLSRPVQPEPPRLPAFVAIDTTARRSLDEPLDVVSRIERRAREAAGGEYQDRLLESLEMHERQHIVDFRAFTGKGAGGKFFTLLSAGLLPGSVRAEVERRAQLAAMRETFDPRVPLAQAIAFMPVEGARRSSEHARGYEALLAEFLDVLDSRGWPGAPDLAELGIDTGRSLLQQLDRLDPETVRAIARAMSD
jgi:hypothetical protein